MKRGMVCWVMLLVGCASSAKPRAADALPAPPGVQYLTLLQQRIAGTRKQMPMISASADACAKRIVDGHRIYVAGAQPEFAKELIERAGGLTRITAPPRLLERGDVVLYAVASRMKVNDQIKVTGWQRQGAYVVLFASEKLGDNQWFPPDILIDSGQSEGLLLADGSTCPTDTVMNLINAWTWTGEFVAACTRLGRMPVLYESYWINTGRARAERYRGKAFHDDLTVAPIAAGVLGNAYLDEMARIFRGIECEAGPKALPLAGQWVRGTQPQRAALLVEAHIFPEHFQDRRAPRPFGAFGFVMRTPPPKFPPLVLLLGYQRPPQLAIDAAYLYRHKLIYTTVERAREDRGETIIYIDPHWPIEDGCVLPRGYDIPILPASAVSQSAIYWSIVAEAVGLKAKMEDGK